MFASAGTQVSRRVRALNYSTGMRDITGTLNEILRFSEPGIPNWNKQLKTLLGFSEREASFLSQVMAVIPLDGDDILVMYDGKTFAFSGNTFEYKDRLKYRLGCQWDSYSKVWIAVP
jgi:uncharacterized membrane protein